jgi:phosphatidate cytidylyltransferase
MLVQRVMTAVVLLIALLVSLTIAAPLGFVALSLAFVGAGMWEWFRLLGFSPKRAAAIAVIASMVLLVLQQSAPADLQFVTLWLFAALVVWIGLATRVSVSGRFFELANRRILSVVLGILLPGATWLALMTMYRFSVWYMLLAMALVWVADIAAYFCGRAFGRHKLAPSISPGKTVEGVAGAMLFAAVFAWLATRMDALGSNLFVVLANRTSIGLMLVATLALVYLSVVGDLFESHLKRQAGVKDSSHLLPGHGGVLDRIDALLPVLPAAALVLTGS